MCEMLLLLDPDVTAGIDFDYFKAIKAKYGRDKLTRYLVLREKGKFFTWLGLTVHSLRKMESLREDGARVSGAQERHAFEQDELDEASKSGGCGELTWASKLLILEDRSSEDQSNQRVDAEFKVTELCFKCLQ